MTGKRNCYSWLHKKRGKLYVGKYGTLRVGKRILEKIVKNVGFLIPDQTNTIFLEQVGFAYSGSDKEVLRDFSFKIEKQ